MESISENCLDSNLISRYLCSDDSSSDSDRNRMEKDYPNMEFIYGEKGHVASLQRLFGAVDSDYILHWEDDWELLEPGRPIEMLLDVIWSVAKVTTAILTPYTHGRNEEDIVTEGKTTKGISYFIPEEGWPGFSLNPALHVTSAIKSIEYSAVKLHEWTFATKYKEAGFLVAHMSRYYVNHFSDATAYLNQSHR